MVARNIKRGDVVYVNLDGAIGSEQSKIRPCVVIQNDIGNAYSPTTIIVPFTSQIKNKNQPTHAIIKKTAENGLYSDSMVLCEQVRTIDKGRITKVCGNVGAENLPIIFKAYAANFGVI